MNRRCFWNWISVAACLNAALVLAEDEVEKVESTTNGALVVSGEDPAPKPNGLRVNIKEGPNNTLDGVEIINVETDVLITEGNPAAEQQNKYWIGLLCTPPAEALRVHLDLPEEVGLVVDAVSDGSPAMKAGIQQYDVLLSVTIPGKGEPDVRSLKNILDLVKAVQSAENGPLKLEFIRRGRKQSLEVLPEERTKANSPDVAVRDLNAVVNTENSLSVPARTGTRGIWAGPIILTDTARIAQPPIPKGMSIELHRKEGQPDKVIVKQGDQTWEVEAKALDTLPKDVAVEVQKQLAWREQNAAGTNSFSLAIAGSATQLHPSPVSALPVPPGVTLTTIREGSEPPKITMKKGDQSWNINAKDIDKIPAELRPFAYMVLITERTNRHPLRGVISLQSGENKLNSENGGGAIVANQAVPAPHPANNKSTVTEKVWINRAEIAPQSIHIGSSQSKGPAVQKQEELERQLNELKEQVRQLKITVEKSAPKE